MRKTTPLLTIALFLLTILLAWAILTSPALAAAHPGCRTVWVIKRHHGRPVRRHHRIVRVRRVKCPVVAHPANAPAPAHPAIMPAPAPKLSVPLPLPSLVEVGNVPGCVFGPTDPRSYLDTYHATVLRVVVKEGRDENPAPCIETAVSEGFRVHVALQWDNHDTPAQVASFVRGELAVYGSLLWAVGLGNEQELGQGGIGGTPQQYAADWKAAEPIVAQLAPRAVRVAGDVAPWGMAYIQQAYADGLPGVQALGAHPYACTTCMDPQQFVGWARAVGLPVWFDEGLIGPHSWGSDVPLAALAGAQIAGAWWDGTVLS